MSIEGTANTEYASLSGKIRTFVVDKTLTISGACADAKATGDKLDSLIDNAETAAEKVASDTTNKKLADFLDSTLTKSDKAAQAAVVGARLDELDAQHTIEKIADVTIAEPTNSFYIELPETLSNYPILFFKAFNVRSTSLGGSGAYIVAVENTESTNTLYNVCGMAVGAGDSGVESAAVIFTAKNADATVSVANINMKHLNSVDVGGLVASGADTKYLYCQTSHGFATDCHFEIWGAVQ